jgi:hypothetical protein
MVKFYEIMITEKNHKLLTSQLFVTDCTKKGLASMQILYYGCPTGRVKKSDSQTCGYDGQIYLHWYKILGLLYKRSLFDLQFVHNLF